MKIKELSLQNIFNAAWQRFVVELAKPAIYNGSCQYITNTSEMCAVGCALPDELLKEIVKEHLNGAPFSGIVSMYPEYFANDIFDYRGDSLNEFQACLHDNIESLLGQSEHKEEVKDLYMKVAQRFNLTVPE